jgi:large subunit ribosomal protein L2
MLFKTKVNHSSGTRHQLNIQKNLLTKYNSIIKNLYFYKKATGGRNNTGRITVRHKGGTACKKRNHTISNKRYNAINICSLYDSKKSSFIALNFDFNKHTFYKSILIEEIYPGALMDTVKVTKIGGTFFLKTLPLGSVISLIKDNKYPFYNKYSLSSGSISQIIDKSKNVFKIRLPSGKVIALNENCYATVGKVFNLKINRCKIGKAGRNRLKGIRPSVRGIAMNPVDHPHGGRSNKGMIQVTPWGLPTKGKLTVKKKL